jgi:hypothetical protein
MGAGALRRWGGWRSGWRGKLRGAS